MRNITESQLRILERLHQFRFLTSFQLQTLGVSPNIRYINQVLRGMVQSGKPTIRKQTFGTLPGIGQLPFIYCLTKAGASTLADSLRLEVAEIHYPKNSQIFQRDYFHRLQTIDLHISARLLAESHADSSLDFFHEYFQTQGSNRGGKNPRKSLSKVVFEDGKSFVPDSIFKITDPHGKPWLFTAEIYRNHTTKRTHAQLKNHLKAIEQGSISQQYDFPRGVPVLVVCESENAMVSLMRRCADDPLFQYTEDYFLFRPHADLAQPFHQGWQTYMGKARVLFQ